MASTSAPPSTRQRLISSTSDLLRRKGLHGFGVSDVLAAAEAPKGVLYHHFPGGKVELAIAAIEAAVSQILRSLEAIEASGGDVLLALRAWLDQAHHRLAKSGYEMGCPLAAVALESTAEDRELRAALNTGFDAIRAHLARLLVQAGMSRAKAPRFAALVVSAYEGALLQARIAGDAKPADETVDLLLEMVRINLAQPRANRPSPRRGGAEEG
ncbi:putative HTH-type transcriptional regulator [Burkholderiales bacterium]|nr:MAG: TetR/AcrR family transcriptional regulator [Burkholderiales bacterium]CAG0992106.1 putative HTH-type transcriptional regulator [Burkholderiales bacterium]